MSGKIGIIYSNDVEDAKKLAEDVQSEFTIRNVLTEKFSTDNLNKDISLAVVIGGDGTILKTARFYCEYDVPVVGINLGRLGFLSQIDPSEIGLVVKSFLEKDFEIQERMMLSEETTQLTALNDIVIKNSDTGRTSRFVLSVNGKNLCEYLADGLIVSTPTGSTAYNLSAGGPIIVPEMDVIVITAICPHTLNARPLVIPADDVISISTKDSEEDFLLTADGQNSKLISPKQTTIIKKYSVKAKLFTIKRENNGFYTVLRDKLHWGKAPICKND